LEEHVGFPIAWGNVTEEALHGWAGDHEFGHCLNAAGKDVNKSIRLAVSEDLADTFAALKAIRDGAPSDTVRVMAAIREHDQWRGGTMNPYFSAKILWKIAEMQDTLSKSEKFRSLDVAGLAGLARDVHAQFGMKKDEMIFVRDVREVMEELDDPLSKDMDLKVKGGGGIERVSLDEWLKAHSDKVPELARIERITNTLKSGPADLGVHQVDEKASMAAIRDLAGKRDGGGKAMLRILTDRKVAPLADAALMDANLGRPTKLASVLPAEQPVQFASAEGAKAAPAKASTPDPSSDQAVRDAGVPDADAPAVPRDAPGTSAKTPTSAAEPAASKSGATPVLDVAPRKPVVIDTQLVRPDGTPLQDGSPAKIKDTPKQPEPAATQAQPAAATPVVDVAAVDRSLSDAALHMSPEMERTVQEVIAELTRVEFAKAEAAKADAARFASRIAMAAPAAGNGIELPPAPGMFDDAPKSPSMLNMPKFASLDPAADWEKSAWLTGSGYTFEDAWSQKPTALASLSDGDDPRFRGAGFIDRNDISRLLDMGRPLEFGGFNAQRDFVKDIVNAARDTKVDPITLLAMCAQESGLGKRNEASTSTGRGPFQFLEQTWLYMVKNHGHRYNMGAEAAKITVDKNGKMKVDDPVALQQILKLRYNTYLSAAIAGEMLQLAKEGIEKSVKRSLSTEEMYLSHVMGEGGARKLLLLAQGAKKNAPATRSFPAAAKANEGLFYKSENGRKRPVSNAELADRMTDKIAKLRVHFADAIKVLDSGFQTANVKMPEQALSENVMPETQEQSQPTYLFNW